MITEILCSYCKNGNIEGLESLIDRGVNVNFHSNRLKKTALHVSVESGHFELVKFLLKNGAYVDSVDKFGFTSLYLAVLYYGYYVKIQNKNKIDQDPDNQLKIESYWNIIGILIHYKANILIRDHTHNTIFHLAAALGILKYIYTVIIEYNKSSNICTLEDINIIPTDSIHSALISPGWGYLSPLHYAADAGCLDTVQFLFDLNIGIDPNIIDACGWTPLHWASKSGCSDVCLYLVNHGANVNQYEFRNMTSSTIARIFKHYYTSELLYEKEKKNEHELELKNEYLSTESNPKELSANKYSQLDVLALDIESDIPQVLKTITSESQIDTITGCSQNKNFNNLYSDTNNNRLDHDYFNNQSIDSSMKIDVQNDNRINREFPNNFEKKVSSGNVNFIDQITNQPLNVLSNKSESSQNGKFVNLLYYSNTFFICLLSYIDLIIKLVLVLFKNVPVVVQISCILSLTLPIILGVPIIIYSISSFTNHKLVEKDFCIISKEAADNNPMQKKRVRIIKITGIIIFKIYEFLIIAVYIIWTPLFFLAPSYIRKYIFLKYYFGIEPCNDANNKYETQLTELVETTSTSKNLENIDDFSQNSLKCNWKFEGTNSAFTIDMNHEKYSKKDTMTKQWSVISESSDSLYNLKNSKLHLEELNQSYDVFSLIEDFNKNQNVSTNKFKSKSILTFSYTSCYFNNYKYNEDNSQSSTISCSNVDKKPNPPGLLVFESLENKTSVVLCRIDSINPGTSAWYQAFLDKLQNSIKSTLHKKKKIIKTPPNKTSNMEPSGVYDNFSIIEEHHFDWFIAMIIYCFFNVVSNNWILKLQNHEKGPNYYDIPTDLINEKENDLDPTHYLIEKLNSKQGHFEMFEEDESNIRFFNQYTVEKDHDTYVHRRDNIENNLSCYSRQELNQTHNTCISEYSDDNNYTDIYNREYSINSIKNTQRRLKINRILGKLYYDCHDMNNNKNNRGMEYVNNEVVNPNEDNKKSMTTFNRMSAEFFDHIYESKIKNSEEKNNEEVGSIVDRNLGGILVSKVNMCSESDTICLEDNKNKLVENTETILNQANSIRSSFKNVDKSYSRNQSCMYKINDSVEELIKIRNGMKNDIIYEEMPKKIIQIDSNHESEYLTNYNRVMKNKLDHKDSMAKIQSNMSSLSYAADYNVFNNAYLEENDDTSYSHSRSISLVNNLKDLASAPKIQEEVDYPYNTKKNYNVLNCSNNKNRQNKYINVLQSCYDTLFSKDDTFAEPTSFIDNKNGSNTVNFRYKKYFFRDNNNNNHNDNCNNSLSDESRFGNSTFTTKNYRGSHTYSKSSSLYNEKNCSFNNIELLYDDQSSGNGILNTPRSNNTELKYALLSISSLLSIRNDHKNINSSFELYHPERKSSSIYSRLDTDRSETCIYESSKEDNYDNTIENGINHDNLTWKPVLHLWNIATSAMDYTHTGSMKVIFDDIPCVNAKEREEIKDNILNSKEYFTFKDAFLIYHSINAKHFGDGYDPSKKINNDNLYYSLIKNRHYTRISEYYHYIWANTFNQDLISNIAMQWRREFHRLSTYMDTHFTMITPYWLYLIECIPIKDWKEYNHQPYKDIEYLIGYRQPKSFIKPYLPSELFSSHTIQTYGKLLNFKSTDSIRYSTENMTRLESSNLLNINSSPYIKKKTTIEKTVKIMGDDDTEITKTKTINEKNHNEKNKDTLILSDQETNVGTFNLPSTPISNDVHLKKLKKGNYKLFIYFIWNQLFLKHIYMLPIILYYTFMIEEESMFSIKLMVRDFKRIPFELIIVCMLVIEILLQVILLIFQYIVISKLINRIKKKCSITN